MMGEDLEGGLRACLRIKFNKSCVEGDSVAAPMLPAQLPDLLVEDLQSLPRPPDGVDSAAKVAERAMVRP